MGLVAPGMWGLPGSGIESVSPALAGGFFITEPLGKPWCFFLCPISFCDKNSSPVGLGHFQIWTKLSLWCHGSVWAEIRKAWKESESTCGCRRQQHASAPQHPGQPFQYQGGWWMEAWKGLQMLDERVTEVTLVISCGVHMPGFRKGKLGPWSLDYPPCKII